MNRSLYRSIDSANIAQYSTKFHGTPNLAWYAVSIYFLHIKLVSADQYVSLVIQPVKY